MNGFKPKKRPETKSYAENVCHCPKYARNGRVISHIYPYCEPPPDTDYDPPRDADHMNANNYYDKSM